jgi:ribosomal 50S subunit-recycling heat shock protein
MRLDKFLKVSKAMKRRTVSKELADQGRISINDKIVKPAHEVKVGDLINVGFGNRQLTIRVLSIEISKTKTNAQPMFEIVTIGEMKDLPNQKE